MPKDSVTSLIDTIAGTVEAAARRTAAMLDQRQYTKELDPTDDKGEMFMILDTDGGWIATTLNEYQANALLSHLNR